MSFFLSKEGHAFFFFFPSTALANTLTTPEVLGRVEDLRLGVSVGDHTGVDVVEDWTKEGPCVPCSEKGIVGSGSKGESVSLVEEVVAYCSWFSLKVLCDEY